MKPFYYHVLTLAAIIGCSAVATGQSLTTEELATTPQIDESALVVSPKSLKISADTRFDFDYLHPEGADGKCGFHGRYLNIAIDGHFNNRLSFHLRQRLNKFGEMRNDVFGATDWVYLNYQPTEHWVFSGGKQVVAIGGMEYDRAPIDIYYASMFWNNIACYQFGVSASYVVNDNSTFLLQMVNSPYQKIGESCFAYNLMWVGHLGNVSTLWSTNLMEYERGRYGHFISLGTRVDMGPLYGELDLMNRYWGKGKYLFGDYSIIAKLCYNTGRFSIFGKGGYENFSPVPGSGVTVDKPFYGGGLEYFPMKGTRDFRLHIVADVTHDNSGRRTSEVACGLKWNVNLINKRF